MAALRESKRALRKQIRQALNSLTPESVNGQSQKATEILIGTKEYQDAKRIAVYLSMEGKEISTKQVVLNALSSGKKVFVPYLYKSQRREHEKQPSIMDMMALRSRQEYETLEKDNWGIPSLPSEHMDTRENWLGGSGLPCLLESNDEIREGQPGGLDLVVVPGVAFDSSLGRLGHGKGYYDRFLGRYQAVGPGAKADRAMPVLVAFALQEQILPRGEEVPSDASDWVMNTIVLGSGVTIS